MVPRSLSICDTMSWDDAIPMTSDKSTMQAFQLYPQIATIEVITFKPAYKRAKEERYILSSCTSTPFSS